MSTLTLGTQIKSLLELKTRSDVSFERDYLKGEFGAVPEIEISQMTLFNELSKEILKGYDGGFEQSLN